MKSLKDAKLTTEKVLKREGEKKNWRKEQKTASNDRF